MTESRRGRLGRDDRGEMTPDPRSDAISRRTFLERAGMLGAAAALVHLPALLGNRGLAADAEAVELDVVRDTFNGLLAFVLPGSDQYSLAQGESAAGPGGVGSGGLDALLETFDRYVPASLLGQPSVTVIPASAGLATLLNVVALEVDRSPASGGFLSPFSRLPFAGKAEVFRRLEEEAPLGDAVEELRFVYAAMPYLAAFLSVSEAGVYDSATDQLRGRPIGWDIARYGGPSDGHPEFKGYYQGRRRARR